VRGQEDGLTDLDVQHRGPVTAEERKAYAAMLQDLADNQWMAEQAGGAGDRRHGRRRGGGAGGGASANTARPSAQAGQGQHFLASACREVTYKERPGDSASEEPACFVEA
jgi:hypothetical protein